MNSMAGSAKWLQSGKITREQSAAAELAVVDTGLHDFLFALQQIADFDNDINVLVDGKNIVEQSDGLHGELFGDNGWFARYSKHGQNPENA